MDLAPSCFLLYRQSKIEARTAIGDIFRLDVTAMRFYDGAHNRQSHPQSLFLGGKEPVEQALVHFSAYACAMIANAQAHFIVSIIASRANLYLASVRWCVPHGINSITDQVHQHLLNLDRISLDQWQVRG
jgi:hypothetical protein